MMLRSLLICAGVLTLAGCDSKVLVVESDTAWIGNVGSFGQVSGTGNGQIEISDAPTNVCWSFRKTTTAGTLRVYLKDATWFGLGEEIDGDAITSDPNGIVEGCNQ